MAFIGNSPHLKPPKTKRGLREVIIPTPLVVLLPDRRHGLVFPGPDGGLLRSEIKKVEKFAQKRDGKDSRLTGYDYHETEDAMEFITVKREICSNDMRDRERDVTIFVYIPDRRRSFICEALSR